MTQPDRFSIRAALHEQLLALQQQEEASCALILHVVETMKAMRAENRAIRHRLLDLNASLAPPDAAPLPPLARPVLTVIECNRAQEA